MENMAIDPAYVRLASTHILKPTVLLQGVDGLDHTEHYPWDPGERARLIVSTWPRGVPIVAVDSERTRRIIDLARENGFDLNVAPPVAEPRLRPHMRGLVGAVEAVLELCGSQDESRQAVRSRAEELQNLSVYRIGKHPVVDLLSVNDPESAEELLGILISEGRLTGKPRLVFLHRNDRPGRLFAFEDLLTQHDSVISGDALPWLHRQRTRLGYVKDLEQVLRKAEGPLILLGNRHSSEAELIQNVLAEAITWKW
jgi:hypothetical protein